MQQHGSKYFAHRPLPPRTVGIRVNWSKFNFFRHGHVAYQIKWNHKMQHHVGNFAADPPPRPRDPKGIGSKGQIQLFQNIVILHIKLMGIMNSATW